LRVTRLVRKDEPKIVRAKERGSFIVPRIAACSPPSMAGMSRIERSILINRPLREVFEFVHDPSKDVMWQTTLVESKPLTGGRLRPGAQVREVRRFLGSNVETTREVTAYSPPLASSFRTVSGPLPFAGSYALASESGATKLTATGEIDGHGFFKLAESVFARMAGRELETSLRHLKDLLEAERT
jgi:hypothetical protein